MERVLVDTNVLVSFLTDRDLGQQARAAELLDSASKQQLRVVLHQVVLTELVYVLCNLYELDKEGVAVILGDLLDLPGVELAPEVAWAQVLDLWPALYRDLADAILAQHARFKGGLQVATFDRRFATLLTRQEIPVFWEPPAP